MPQLSLYIDEITLKKIELAAKIENLSISKYVVNKINDVINDTWPAQFDKLFGSITDETFGEINTIPLSEDIAREEL